MSGTDVRSHLLGAADVRALAARYDVRPTKQRGQNFVIDANTVRRIVTLADVRADDVVLEVGPGLGSLTLALLPVTKHVIAIEIDPVLARALPVTATERAPNLAVRLTVLEADALSVDELDPLPTALVANLPYNVAVPVVLHLLERFTSIERVLVMVQAEVADRLVAGPGSRTYGVPSAKAAWFAEARRVGSVSPGVFWPVPRVDSGLVALRRRPPPPTSASRAEVFAVIDAAFGQRRKTLRSALASWAGSPPAAEEILRRASVDPTLRGEQLGIEEFAQIAEARGTASGP
jgi:16S rRNA (adenine1518-N6/adenine1519-N6)-dimethyltransferase